MLCIRVFMRMRASEYKPRMCAELHLFIITGESDSVQNSSLGRISDDQLTSSNDAQQDREKDYE